MITAKEKSYIIVTANLRPWVVERNKKILWSPFIAAAFWIKMTLKQYSHSALIWFLIVGTSLTFATAFTTSRMRTLPRSSLLYREDSEGISSWTLQEDWALLDQLGRFTVGEGEQARTFWTQLVTSTPALSPKSSKELFERCQVLDHNRTYGPSPPLLTNWRLEGNRAAGTLEDGRVVWMHYHVVGRLPGDLFSDATSPSLMALIPGGYLEALGGRIYELGQPAREMKISVSTFTPSRNDGSNIWQEDEETPKVTEHPNGMAWWIPATTGTVSAMLASTVLSACIGYGAGLGIIADEHGPHHHVPPLEHHTTTSIPATHYKLSSFSTPSVEENKARTEYKILREQRLLQRISEQLERDRADLQGLERIQIFEQQTRAENHLP